MGRRAILLCATLSLSAHGADALEVQGLDVTVAEGEYRVVFDATIEAPVEDVARVLTDYVGYAALDPRIETSEVIGAAVDGDPLVRTRINACAGVFCRRVERVERVRVGDGRIVAEALPERSDVRHSVAETRWRPDGDRTSVHYEAAFAPDFWIPSWIERRYAPRALRQSVRRLFQNVEDRALGR